MKGLSPFVTAQDPRGASCAGLGRMGGWLGCWGRCFPRVGRGPGCWGPPQDRPRSGVLHHSGRGGEQVRRSIWDVSGRSGWGRQEKERDFRG